MFCYAKIAWSLLLKASIGCLLKHYEISSGILVIDDTAKQRAKKTTKIAGAHKVKDKKSGGYFNGQELVFMALVSELVTFAVGIRWYTPDPTLSSWREENRRLKGLGVPASQRPARPALDPNFVPNVDSIGLVVRMLCQCSAGKS